MDGRNDGVKVAIGTEMTLGTGAIDGVTLGTADGLEVGVNDGVDIG